MISQDYEKDSKEQTNVRAEVVNTKALFNKNTNIKVLFPDENGHLKLKVMNE